jgi:succinate dehydrogenase/fumarate reductase flavoprotein subunit
MAEAYFSGGSMHGDLALVEAAVSPRAFANLVNLGLPFPRDRYGQFVGYRTDHDPKGRATSIGPYTSRDMCRALIRQVRELNIPVRTERTAVELLTVETHGRRRAAGVVAIRPDGELEAYAAENVVFAVGGPGGLYRDSVYPAVHTGAIGLALLAGARAQNLPESQFGLASIRFRWNVSGSYMQAIPRVISTGHKGDTEREFLCEAFESPGALASAIFLKGYQWPFDARKVVGGSSLIDLVVWRETAIRGQRVFLDFRGSPAGFSFEHLSPEPLDYLTRSHALQETPIERLRALNPGAIAVYAEHGIDLTGEPLEVAVCAQHNNGGLAGNLWWESPNLAHLFPVGEVNGSHGVYRPGGSALNAGQVGGLRAAEYVAHRYASWTLPEDTVRQEAQAALVRLLAWARRCSSGRSIPWQDERTELQVRMTRAGAHIRAERELREATREAWSQWRRLEHDGCAIGDLQELTPAFTTRQLCFAHAVYMEAIHFAVASGVGSRGSAVVLDPQDIPVHREMEGPWRIAPEDPAYRERVLETTVLPDGRVHNAWVPRRPIPQSDTWFETAWARFRSGEVHE